MRGIIVALAAWLVGFALAQHSTVSDSLHQKVAASADDIVLKDEREANEAGAKEEAPEVQEAASEEGSEEGGGEEPAHASASEEKSEEGGEAEPTHKAASEEENGGGHGEGEEGNGAEEERKGEAEPSDAMKTTSYLLIGFLVVNFVMVSLVNYNDANVRSYTWKMMSACVSIYLAVVVDGSVSRLCLDLVQKLVTVADADEEGMEGVDLDTVAHRVSAVLQVVLFVACFVGVNFFCYKTQNKPHRLYAVSVVGGHLTAFALTKAWMQMHAGKMITWATPVVVFAVLAGMRFGSRKVRIRWFGEQGETLEREENAERQETQELFETAVASEGSAAVLWPKWAAEAEDDASAIVQSFVIREIVVSAYFDGEERNPLSWHAGADIIRMFGAELVCLVLVVAMACIGKLARKMAEENRAGVMFDRIFENLETTVAMTMSWLALDLFFWISCWFFDDVEANFIAIISAAILTACSILGIIILDMFADKVEAKNAETQKEDSKHSNPSGAQEEGRRSNQHGAHEQPSGVREVTLGERAEKHKEEILKEAMDLGNLERGIRSVITSIALSVGLAWEHAFHEATHTIIQTNPSLHAYKTLSMTCIAGLSVALMLPVWLKYIARKAMKPVRDHQAMMDMDNQQAGEL